MALHTEYFKLIPYEVLFKFFMPTYIPYEVPFVDKTFEKALSTMLGAGSSRLSTEIC